MSVLTLRLAGPLQSWGSASRFARRATEAMPTKSGILGLLAAAQGRRRSDEIEDLLHLTLAVRTDQQGTLLRDFHTAHHPLSGKSMPLTNRYYWSDAVFTAYIGGDRALLEGLKETLERPAYPLYFGRRSCVPAKQIVVGEVEDVEVSVAVAHTPWQAGYSGRQLAKGLKRVDLPVQADQAVYPDQLAGRELSDVPVSFNPQRRMYRTRQVVDTIVSLPTGNGTERSSSHDPMSAVLGVSQ